jgi:hypothetical protein
MEEFGYTKGKMASEIDDTATLLYAQKLGYGTFGAGGFFGDSSKVWEDPNTSMSSMAVKAVDVRYETPENRGFDGVMPPYIKVEEGVTIAYPVKIGDPEKLGAEHAGLKEGKLSLTRNLDKPTMDAIKRYVSDIRVAAAAPAPAPAPEPLSNYFNLDTGAVTAGGAGGGRRTRNRRTRNRRTRNRRTRNRRTNGLRKTRR